jgi:hypothetical protein
MVLVLLLSSRLSALVRFRVAPKTDTVAILGGGISFLTDLDVASAQLLLACVIVVGEQVVQTGSDGGTEGVTLLKTGGQVTRRAWSFCGQDEGGRFLSGRLV